MNHNLKTLKGCLRLVCVSNKQKKGLKTFVEFDVFWFS